MVFFDIDGTLIDHDLAVSKAVHQVYMKFHENFGLTSYYDFYISWVKYSKYCYNRYLSGELDLEKQRKMRVALAFSKPSLEDKYAESVSNFFLKNYEDNCTLFPDVENTLNLLISNNIKLGIISNGDMAQQFRKLKKNNIHDFFSVKIFSSATGYSKPCHEIFSKALEFCSYDDGKHYYIGDDYATDIAPCLSEEISLSPVLISRGKKHTKSLTSFFEINDLKWLPEIIL